MGSTLTDFIFCTVSHRIVGIPICTVRSLLSWMRRTILRGASPSDAHMDASLAFLQTLDYLLDRRKVPKGGIIRRY